jgi:hypothetical protein
VKFSYCTGDVDSRRTANSVEVPSSFTHRITNFENTDARISGAKCHDGGRRRSDDVELGYRRFDCVGNGPCAGDD